MRNLLTIFIVTLLNIAANSQPHMRVKAALSMPGGQLLDYAASSGG